MQRRFSRNGQYIASDTHSLIITSQQLLFEVRICCVDAMHKSLPKPESKHTLSLFIKQSSSARTAHNNHHPNRSSLESLDSIDKVCCGFRSRTRRLWNYSHDSPQIHIQSGCVELVVGHRRRLIWFQCRLAFVRRGGRAAQLCHRCLE